MAATRSGWVLRRAQRLQAFFGIDRGTALASACEDYLAFAGARRRAHGGAGHRTSTAAVPVHAARDCDTLGVCQLHATGRQGCDACPIPRNTPAFAPGVIDGPHRARSGWRASLRALCDWLMGSTAW